MQSTASLELEPLASLNLGFGPDIRTDQYRKVHAGGAKLIPILSGPFKPMISNMRGLGIFAYFLVDINNDTKISHYHGYSFHRPRGRSTTLRFRDPPFLKFEY